MKKIFSNLKFVLSLGITLLTSPLANSIALEPAQNFDNDVAISVFGKTPSGYVRHCLNKKNFSVAGEKTIKLELLHSKQDSQAVNLRLAIDLVSCVDGSWARDEHPQYSIYKKQKIFTRLNFSKFELVVVDNNYNVLWTSPLDGLKNRAHQILNVQFDRSSVKGPIQIFVRTLISSQSSNGFKQGNEIRSFGAYFFNLN